MKKLVWNVYYHDVNGEKIKVVNVFKHSSFNKDVEKLLKEKSTHGLTYNEFSKELKHIVQYYFWRKAEYEVVVTSWVPHIDNKELDRLISERANHSCYSYYVNLDVENKIDIYEQLMLNWEQFVNYVWKFDEGDTKWEAELMYE